MDKILQFLKDLLPLEIAALIVIFIYFLKLFKDLASDFNKIAQQQAEYMRQRVESVDKTTSIFERTVEHQEKDLKRLYELNEKLKGNIETKKEEGIERLDSQLKDVVESIEQLREEKLSIEETSKLKAELDIAKRDTTAKYTSLIETLETPEQKELVKISEIKKVFVVMPYSEEASRRYELIKSVIANEGLEAYTAHEVLMQGADIATNIRRCIETADLILVDITNRNASVMYELGYTHAIGKPVILLAADDEDIPFDVANYRIIIFDGSVKGLEVLHDRLGDAIKDIRKKAISKKAANWIQVVSEAMPYSEIVNLLIRLIR